LKNCTEHAQCFDYNNSLSKQGKVPDLKLSADLVDRIIGEDELHGLVPASNRNVKVNLKKTLDQSYVEHKTHMINPRYSSMGGSKQDFSQIDMFEANSTQ